MALTLSTGLTYLQTMEESSIFLPISRDDDLGVGPLILGYPQGQNYGLGLGPECQVLGLDLEVLSPWSWPWL